MGLTVGSNIASLRIQRQAAQTSGALSKVYARLSSGLRINSASDDPAGLIVADSLRSDAKLAAVAASNANDAISLSSITDDALTEVYDILSRMGELATESGNGTYTNTQRSAMSSEFLALGSEVERISQTTTFNGRYLLSNSSAVTIQVGITGTASTSQITLSAVQSTLASLGLASGGSSTLSYSIIATTSAASVTAASLALSAISTALDSVYAARGTVEAAQSRLTSAVSYLQVMRENFIAAESRIRDADVASDVAEMARLQILADTQAALLAQANQDAATVLKLFS